MSELTDDFTPSWVSGVRTRYDEARDRWMILGPERILVPEGPGADIARRIDGQRSLGDIVAELTAEYDADEETIRTETVQFLRQLIRRKYVTDSAQ